MITILATKKEKKKRQLRRQLLLRTLLRSGPRGSTSQESCTSERFTLAATSDIVTAVLLLDAVQNISLIYVGMT